MTEIELWFDGACEPVNPGGVGSYGWLLLGLPGRGDVTGSGVAGEGPGMTNNVAEYGALLAGLRFLADALPGVPDATLVVRGDSQLVVRQVGGEWGCKSLTLRPLLDEAMVWLAGLGVPWRIEWVPRDANDRADALSREGYERHTGRPFPERTNAAQRGGRR